MANSEEKRTYPFCPDESKYEKLAKIGQGTFGMVFKARDRRTQKIVAMKKILTDNESEGFPMTAMREIKILQVLKHENIVNLLEICRVKESPYSREPPTVYLVFEFCEHDLAGLLNNPQVKFTLAEIKNVMQQLLNGLYFIHSNKIFHRDIKTANILITKSGKLKLADFGLARPFSDRITRYTSKVVTLWYRPPEILLGEKNYTTAVDLWGAGCIMAEMWTRSPIMRGNTEQHQITLISQLCGSIIPEVWPDVENLDVYKTLNLPQNHRREVNERLALFVKDQLALDLINRLLVLDPSKRANANDSLDHDFFWTDPMPQEIGNMLSHHNRSMFELMTRRAPLRPQQQPSAMGVLPFGADQYFERIF